MFQIDEGARSFGPGRRTRPRLLVAADIRAKSANSADWMFATLRDVSMGGARLVVEGNECQPGGSIDIRLPCKDHEDLVVDAEILRVEPCDDGSVIGVKFETDNIAHRSKVDDTLAVLLSQTGGGRRAHARVSSRMDIQYGDHAELKGILEDLSEGGFLMLTVDVAPNLGQLVQVRIPNPRGADLNLCARVVRRSNASPDARPDTLVGLQFENLSDDDEEEIGLLIDWLLFLRDEPGVAA